MYLIFKQLRITTAMHHHFIENIQYTQNVDIQIREFSSIKFC